MQAVILAGGKGTRLQGHLGGLPKPMVDFGGKPLLEFQIELLRSAGFQDIVLLLGYSPDAITEHFGDGRDFGVRISYAVEESPLGSAGAVLSVLDGLEDRFLVVYGDTALNIDLQRFAARHAAVKADASLLVHPNDHPHDSDLVEADEQGKIVALHPYPRQTSRSYPNLVSAALFFVEKTALLPWKALAAPLDFGRDVFPMMVAEGRYLFAYRSREYIKDIGTPERLERALSDLRSGRIASGSFATPARAVFLDRDGTINHEVGNLSDPEQFRLLPGAAQAIGKLNRAGYIVVVITNQPVVARGDCTEETVREIHNRMETQLGEGGAYVDAIYYCPHHPEGGFPGERPELKIACSCRKPEPGLIEAARLEMNLDPARSWMAGDRGTDVEAAIRAGVRSVLVESGPSEGREALRFNPDYRFPSLAEAAEFIVASGEER